MALPPAPRMFPALAVLTLTLLGTLVAAGGGLLWAMNQIFTVQIEATARSTAQLQFDYLKGPFSQMLWEYNLTGAKAVASAVARSDDVLALTLQGESGPVLFEESRPGPSYLSLSEPLVSAGRTVGTLTLRFSSRSIEAQRSAVFGYSLVVFATFIVLVSVVIPLLLNRTVLRPFNRLSGFLAQDPGAGAFPGLPEPSSSIREIRMMESALGTLNRAVVRQVEELETRVRERTAELELAQAAMVHAETMATLGQLAAGIAHELNTPLGAISSSVRFLQGQWRETLIPHLARSLTIPGAADPAAFLEEIGDLASDLAQSPSPSVQRRFRARWTALGRDPGTSLCDMVSETGLSVRIEDLARWPEDHEANAAVELVAVWGRTLAILATAVEKGASVVSALRSQVHTPLVREPRILDLRQEIEQALILLQSRTRNGIKVRVEASEDLKVLGEGEELGKVWLNILLNAIQAMDGTGNLEVRLTGQGTWAVVEFVNDGPVIPPDLLARIFDPFFTTKGNGMGLGLAIVRNVIEKNLGRLEVESVPGHTTFRVFLVRQTGEPARKGL